MARYAGVRPAGGGIEIRYQVRGRRYSRFINEAPTDSALQDAARLRRRLIEQAKLGEPEATAGPLRFEDACRAFLRDASRERKPSTVLTYRRKLEAHWSALAGLDVRQVTLAAVKAVDREIEWRTQKTRRDSLSVLSGVLRWAITEGYIDSNPVERIRVGRHQTPPVEPFTPAEVAAILGALRGTARAFYGLMRETGLRTGELRALRWSEVGEDAITVSGTMFAGRVVPTKTSRVRRVLLTREARRILRDHTATRFAGGHVFLTQHGNPYADDTALTDAFRAACEAAGVPYRRPYTLRHTYASEALSRGVEPAWLAEQMGDLLTTVVKHYARWMGGERDARELAKLEASGE